MTCLMEREFWSTIKTIRAKTSIAVNTERDVFMEEIFIVDESL